VPDPDRSVDTADDPAQQIAQRSPAIGSPAPERLRRVIWGAAADHSRPSWRVPCMVHDASSAQVRDHEGEALNPDYPAGLVV